jgi:hypothetical protein
MMIEKAGLDIAWGWTLHRVLCGDEYDILMFEMNDILIFGFDMIFDRNGVNSSEIDRRWSNPVPTEARDRSGVTIPAQLQPRSTVGEQLPYLKL